MRQFILLALCLLFSLESSAKVLSVHFIKVPGLLAAASSLNSMGEVMMTAGQKFIYLKITDEHINTLYPLLKNDLPYVMRDCLQPATNKLGAHVTLFEPENITPVMWPKIKTLIGKNFAYTEKAEKIIFDRKGQKGKMVEETWFVIAIDAPQLSAELLKIDPTNPYFKQLHYSIAVSRRMAGHCVVTKRG